MATATQSAARFAAPPPQRRPRRKLGPGDHAKIRELAKQGASQRSIAKIIGVTSSCVCRLEKTLGIDRDAIAARLRLLAPPPSPQPEPPAQKTGTWELCKADAESLREWQRKSGDVGGLDRFVAQIVQVAIVDYRRSLRTAAPP